MPVPTPVSDTAHSQDRIALAAREIGRSRARREIFEIVYRGKKKTKGFSEIVRTSRKNEKTLYNAAKHLDKNQVIHQVKVAGEIAYQKDSFLDAHKKKILSLAGNRGKLAKFPTSTNPQGSHVPMLVKLPRQLVKVSAVTVDDIDSFKRVKRVVSPPTVFTNALESVVKRGFKRIIGEVGVFKDWGGEQNDLYTTRVKLKGKRIAAAFAFKGRGTRKKLTPRDMGKNGNQIQRLFMSPAELFIVQHVGEIDEAVVQQMYSAAVTRSYHTGEKTYFGVIDGADTLRLMAAYPRAFR